MELLVEISAILGFVISVITFVLTRWERRRIIEIEIFDAMAYELSDFEGWPKESEHEYVMKVRFTNLGSQAVIIKPKTLLIESNGKVFYLDRFDFVGMDSFKEVITPMSSAYIGIFQSDILETLSISSPEKYDDEAFNKLYRLNISVKDHKGRCYRNNRYSYHEAIAQYVT
ncbi:hypothetical protein [Vibrio sp. AK197]